MKTRRFVTGLASVLFISGGAVVALAQQENAAPEWEAPTPGERHEPLRYFVGEWDAEMRMSMTKGTPAEEGAFQSSMRMIMNGMYLEENVTSETPMGTFLGRGVIGFDESRQRYVSTWIDTDGSGIGMSEGYWDEEARVFEFTGEFPDMMTGELKTSRMMLQIDSENEFHLKEWIYEDDGTRWQRFAAEYTRRRGR